MATSYSDTARQQAADILAKPPFASAPSHQVSPLGGVLHAIGQGLRFVFGGAFRWIYRHMVVHVGHGFVFVFGSWWPYAAVVVAVLVGAAVALLVIRRRARVPNMAPNTGGVGAFDLGADELRHLATEAARRNDFEQALRLLFRWGVRRLGEVGAVSNGASRTDGELIQEVRTPAFADVQGRHERIVYGRQEATVDDVTASEEGWSKVLSDMSGRSRQKAAVGG